MQEPTDAYSHPKSKRLRRLQSLDVPDFQGSPGSLLSSRDLVDLPQYLAKIESSHPLARPSWAPEYLHLNKTVLFDVYMKHEFTHTGYYMADSAPRHEVVQQIHLDQQNMYCIGRNPVVCDIVLDDTSISRRHAAVIHHKDQGIYIVDLNSGHKTYIGTEALVPYQPTVLSHNSHVRFGASPHNYILKCFDSQQNIELAWEKSKSGEGMDDRQTYINTRLNRCASYRCDGVVFFMNAKSPCQIRKNAPLGNMGNGLAGNRHRYATPDDGSAHLSNETPKSGLPTSILQRGMTLTNLHPIDVKLQNVLNDQTLLDGFGEFIVYEHEQNAHKKLRPVVNFALTALNFWLYATEYSKLPPSIFRTISSRYLYDHFVSKDAVTLAPLQVETMANLCAQFSQCGQNGISTDALIPAKAEVYDFLNAGAFKRFLRDKSPHGFREVKTSTSIPNLKVKAVKGKMDRGLQAKLRRDSRKKSTEALIYTVKGSSIPMAQVIESPTLCRFLKAFLLKQKCAHFLSFHVDAKEFEYTFDILHQNEAQFEESTANGLVCDGSNPFFEFVLTLAQGIYLKYIMHGCESKVPFSSGIVSEIRRKLCKSKVSSQLFQPALLAVRQFMENLYPLFCNSAEYHSMISMKDQFNDRRKKIRPQSLAGRRGTSNGPYFEPVPLPVVVATSLIKYFHEFLKSKGHSNSLLFLTELQNFRDIPESNLKYLNTSAQKIYDRFLKDGARLAIDIPADMKRLILQDMAQQAYPSIFNDVEDHLSLLMAQRNYPEYIADPSYIVLQAYHYYNVRSYTIDMTPNDATDEESSFEVQRMHEILKFDELQEYWHRYMDATENSSLLVLWLTIEEFKSNFEDANIRSNVAQKIYNDYVKLGGINYVPILTEKTRLSVAQGIQQLERTTFDEVQHKIFDYMAHVLYPTFKESTEYFSLDLKRHAVSRKLREGEDESHILIGKRHKVLKKRENISVEREFSDMMKVLHHSEGLKNFEQFCSSSTTPHVLHLWIEVEDMNKINSNPYLKKRAAKVCDRYLIGGLSEDFERPIVSKIQQCINEPHELRVALKELQNFEEQCLQVEHFPLFLKSASFATFLQKLKLGVVDCGAITHLRPTQQAFLKRRKRKPVRSKKKMPSAILINQLS